MLFFPFLLDAGSWNDSGVPYDALRVSPGGTTAAVVQHRTRPRRIQMAPPFRGLTTA